MFGHLFSGRSKSLIGDGSGSGYLKSGCDYVHLNPVRAKLVTAKAPLRSFVWSSWPAYWAALSRRPGWLRVDRLLGQYGITKASPAGRGRLQQAFEERRGAQEGEEFQPIRRGWCLGQAAFRQDLLTQMRQRLGAKHYGEERAETEAAKAERIVAEELPRHKWTADLQTRPKGDAKRLALAAHFAGGNDGDGGLDCGAPEHGQPRLSPPPAVSSAEGNKGIEVTIKK